MEEIYKIDNGQGSMEVTGVNIRMGCALARSYRPVFSFVELRKLLHSVVPGERIDSKDDFDLRSRISDLIMYHHDGETKIKWMLVNKLNHHNAVGAYEIRAGKSRIDFVQINGNTISYEIKSAFDTLGKLGKQIVDYQRLFEYNYVVCDSAHLNNLRDILPRSYGIYLVSNNNLCMVRRALLNKNIDPKAQLAMFTKKETVKYFGCTGKTLRAITTAYPPKDINEVFKKLLKSRYAERWEFLLANKQNILPIDYQFFFMNGIDPATFYGR